MTWWEMMQIVWWGSLGWALVLIVPAFVLILVSYTFVQMAEARERARLEALRDEYDRNVKPNNGRDHGKN